MYASTLMKRFKTTTMSSFMILFLNSKNLANYYMFMFAVIVFPICEVMYMLFGRHEKKVQMP